MLRCLGRRWLREPSDAQARVLKHCCSECCPWLGGRCLWRSKPTPSLQSTPPTTLPPAGLCASQFPPAAALPTFRHTCTLVCLQSLLQPLDVRVKWPNDIYVSGLKIGGILINTTISQGRFNIVCGVGLNLDNRQPTTCINQLLTDALAAQAAQAGSVGSQWHHHSRVQAQGEGAAGAGSTAAGHEGAEQHGSSSADGGSGSSRDAIVTVASGAAPGPHQAGGAAAGAGSSAAASSTVGSGSGTRGLVSRERLLACVMNQLEQCFQVSTVARVRSLPAASPCAFEHQVARKSCLFHPPATCAPAPSQRNLGQSCLGQSCRRCQPCCTPFTLLPLACCPTAADAGV